MGNEKEFEEIIENKKVDNETFNVKEILDEYRVKGDLIKKLESNGVSGDDLEKVEEKIFYMNNEAFIKFWYRIDYCVKHGLTGKDLFDAVMDERLIVNKNGFKEKITRLFLKKINRFKS